MLTGSGVPSYSPPSRKQELCSLERQLNAPLGGGAGRGALNDETATDDTWTVRPGSPRPAAERSRP